MQDLSEYVMQMQIPVSLHGQLCIRIFLEFGLQRSIYRSRATCMTISAERPSSIED